MLFRSESKPSSLVKKINRSFIATNVRKKYRKRITFRVAFRPMSPMSGLPRGRSRALRRLCAARAEASARGGPPLWACSADFDPQIRCSRSSRWNSSRRIDFFCRAFSFFCAFGLIQKHRKIKHCEKSGSSAIPQAEGLLNEKRGIQIAINHCCAKRTTDSALRKIGKKNGRLLRRRKRGRELVRVAF